MEEFNAIDWGNIEEVMPEIRVQDEWQILQNKLRKRKKKRIIIYFLWMVLAGSIGLSYLFNINKFKKIETQQKDNAISNAIANQEHNQSIDLNQKAETKISSSKVESSSFNSTEVSKNSSNQSSNISKNKSTIISPQFTTIGIDKNNLKSDEPHFISAEKFSSVSEASAVNASINEPNEILYIPPVQNSDDSESIVLDRVIEAHSQIPILQISNLNTPECQSGLPILVNRNNLIKKRNHYINHVALFFSYALAQQKFSSSSSESKLIVERRMKIESPKEQLKAGLVFEKNLKNSFELTTGIIVDRQITGVNEQLKFTSVEKLDDFPAEILIDKNGNQEIVTSTKEIVVNNRSSATFYNHYYSISIPIGIKKEFYAASRIQTGIATSLGLNVYRNFSGYLLDPLKKESYIKTTRNEFLQSVFNDLNLSLYSKFKLARGGSIGVNVFYSYGLNSWELYNGISESFNQYGIGMSYYFK
jgi:hypothetical protein